MFGSERDRFPLFSHIVVCLLSLTRVRLCRINIRHIRTCVLKMQTPDMLKIPESGLIHFLLYWLRYEKIAATSHINSAKKRKRSQNTTIR